MMSRAALVLFFALAPVCAQAPAVSEFDVKMLRFHDAWMEFVAEYGGCPMPTGVGAIEAVECRPMLGQLNRGKLDKAKRTGLAFFDLIED